MFLFDSAVWLNADANNCTLFLVLSKVEAEKLAWEKERWKEEAELEKTKWEEKKAWEKKMRVDERDKGKRADEGVLAFKVQKYHFVRSALEKGLSMAEAKEWLAMVEQ